MNKILLILCLTLLISCDTNETKTVEPSTSDIENLGIDKDDPYFKMFTNFMLFDKTHLFRGVNLNMTEKEVRQIESGYPVSSEMRTEKANEIYFEVNLSNEPLDFVDLRYNFNEGKLVFISAEGYCSNEKKSKSFYKNLETYYTNTIGKGEYADDGYLEFKTKNGDQNVMVAIKEVNFPPAGSDKGSYGFFLLYSL